MKKLHLLAFFSLFTYFSVSCQIVNASVNAHFGSMNAQIEGGDSLAVKIIHTETRVDDLDFFGELLIAFTEINSGFTVYIVKKTKAEILQEGLLSNGIIHIPGYNIENDRSYKIRFIVRDYQGNNIQESEFLLTH